MANIQQSWNQILYSSQIGLGFLSQPAIAAKR